MSAEEEAGAGMALGSAHPEHEDVGDEEQAASAEESMETQPPASPAGPVEEEGDKRSLTACTGGAGSDDRKLFVGRLSWETTETTLKSYFSQYGEVKDVQLKCDQETQCSRGFAFVVFDVEGAVQRVLDEGPHTIDQRTVDAKRAIPHQVHQAMKNRTRKIFVGGVPTDMSEVTIRDYFVQYGEIEEVALVTDKASGKRRGFVFVTFVSMDSVDTCTEKSFHTVASHQVEVKRATPREQNPAGPLPRGRARGRGGGHGRGGWHPYGQYTGVYGYPPFPGYACPVPYAGFVGGYEDYDGSYGRQGGSEGLCPPVSPHFNGGPLPAGRYGPIKSNCSHGYHPYSR